MSDSDIESLLPYISEKKVIPDSQVCLEMGLLCAEMFGSRSTILQERFNYQFIYHSYQDVTPADIDYYISFRKSKIHKGAQLQIPPLTPAHSHFLLPKFLHRDLIPLFMNMSIDDLMTAFQIPKKKEMAIRESLRICASANASSKRRCLLSGDQMGQFAAELLQKASTEDLMVLSYNKFHTSFEAVEVVDHPSTIVNQTQGMVSCHALEFPFALYFCHKVHDTMAHHAIVKGNKEEHQQLIYICHMNTIDFPPHHLSLRMLHLKPGGGEVCHWVANSDVIFY